MVYNTLNKLEDRSMLNSIYKNKIQLLPINKPMKTGAIVTMKLVNQYVPTMLQEVIQNIKLPTKIYVGSS